MMQNGKKQKQAALVMTKGRALVAASHWKDLTTLVVSWDESQQNLLQRAHFISLLLH